MRIVVALDGKALLQPGEPPDAEIQEKHVNSACAALAPLARDHQLIITHGDGPQVGVPARDNAAGRELSSSSFDQFGAQTQATIGYWIARALSRTVPGQSAACLRCRIVVRADDPAMSRPVRFVGPVYDETSAGHLAASRGWQMCQDGTSWRRLVPSLEPVQIAELDLIKRLLSAGVLVICVGVGGIPVTRHDRGGLRGVEAVSEEDLTAALLASAVGADALLILTDGPAVIRYYGTVGAQPIRHATVAELRAISFAGGSMGPKVEAACRFAETAGGIAAIGRPDDAAELLIGAAGTTVTP